MALITVVCGAVGLVFAWGAAAGCVYCWPLIGLMVMVWAGGLAFFRDPERIVPADPATMLAPADGTVTEVADLDNHNDIGGPARRISIFLSVFDVHVNRSPCAGTVRLLRYQPGQFLDARHADSGRLNESNTIVIEPDNPAEGPVVVRQVAGLIARRIVCDVKVGDRLARGQRVGLIKFGSRTDLIFPAGSAFVPIIRVGDKVRGALTVMARRQAAAEQASVKEFAAGA